MKKNRPENPAHARNSRQVRFTDGSRVSADVQSALSDPQRYCPMFSGPCLIRDDAAILRHMGGDIEIKAPRKLLETAFALCDGRSSLHDVLQRFSQQNPSPEALENFGMFLDFLRSEGALIDAALGCASHSAYAFQRSSFGKGALPSITQKIAERFAAPTTSKKQTPGPQALKISKAPLKEFFEARQSCYTFDAGALSRPKLLMFLWSLAGIVNNEHPRLAERGIPHRTLASAGSMHLLEIYAVLQHGVGDLAAGVYRIEYPGEKAVRFIPVNQEQWLLPRAFGKPWQLKHAAGAVFLAAPPEIGALRYRNRSVQYLFMEAGAALQNGGLSASQLGMGFATLGSYYEDIAADICGLTTQMLFGAAIFGAKPTSKQRQLERTGNQFDFAWVQGYSDDYTLPFYMGRAELQSGEFNLAPTWGRGSDPWTAVLKAQAEAVERLGYHQPKNVIIGKIGDVPAAMAPQDFISYHASQYQRAGFPYRPFDEQSQYAWASGLDLLSGQKVHVLADLVFTRDALSGVYANLPAPYAQMTSSGCAAGINAEDAAYRGLLEVIERDAFTRHWLTQLPGAPVNSGCFPSSIQARVRALELAGCIVEVQKLASDWANVALVSAQHEAHHFTTMATAAHANFTEAVLAALEELEGRVFSHFSEHLTTLGSFEDVSSADHHFEVYRLKAHFKKADKVLFPRKARNRLSAWPATQPVRTLAQLLKRFKSAGRKPVTVDITPHNPTIDQGRTRLTVVKAMVPGLLPIYFGYQREPFGMVTRILEGSRFPHPFP